METIKRQVEDKFQGEFGEDAVTEVETVENEDTAENEVMVENEAESVAEKIVNVEEVNNNVIDSVDHTRHNLNDDPRKIVERLNEIMLKGLKKRDYKEKNEPRWKRRIEGDIKKLRQDVNLLIRDLKGELGSKKKQKNERAL